MMRFAIIGAGGWGTALGIIAARAGHQVRLWSRNASVINSINERGVNELYLATHRLPEGVKATSEIESVFVYAEIVLLAAPSHATRELLVSSLPHVRPEMLFVSATKGIEIQTGERISEVVTEVVGEKFTPRFVCLSGPSFAKEVAAGQPTAIVAAGLNPADATTVQRALSWGNLRVYTNDDVVGTELGGALKNVMALAAGMIAGSGLGANSVAALVTRGLAEMTRFAVRQGARVETLAGLAGLGDLVLTCTGTLSRNRRVGYELGRGRKLEDVLGEMREVAEGVRTTRAVKSLAESCGVEMPITNEVDAVLYEGKSVKAAVEELMSRPVRDEFKGTVR
ncbi:MAG: NAD(P)-dependent glycerol-3-phosphate dehydrogenase [Pyrinomonadaceae bacterium]|nr:NAD(P)-dependent glycerol-3-phosphate dehydrogenase [Pyrinomonadaceae bacterium]